MQETRRRTAMRSLRIKESEWRHALGTRLGRTRALGVFEEPPEEALKRRPVEIARRRLEAQRAFYEEGRITIDRYLDASNELRLAEMDASKTREDRIAAAQAHLDRAKDVEAREQKEFEEGRSTMADVTEAEQYRVKAELHLRAAENPAGRSEIELLQDRVHALEGKLDLVLKALKALELEQRPRSRPL